jgi:hypothetical protein
MGSRIRRQKPAVAYIFVFLVVCIGLGVSSNYAALVVLRCVQSTGSASSIAIGAGVRWGLVAGYLTLIRVSASTSHLPAAAVSSVCVHRPSLVGM